MPELPEVETSRRGIKSHIEGQRLDDVIIREGRMRWPIDPDLPKLLAGQELHSVGRRGKYLLLNFASGTLLMHLGMSGSLRIVDHMATLKKHDHVDLVFGKDCILRFNDPRRFGAILWAGKKPDTHPLLNHLGPEPLSDDFDGNYLHQRAGGKKIAIKQFIMDSKVVVGVGNIYANESLFLSGIHPNRAAGRISKQRMFTLAAVVKKVIAAAITQGGTTLKDFTQADGKPGYFKQELRVYGRAGEPCVSCGNTLREMRQNNRATCFCAKCQT